MLLPASAWACPACGLAGAGDNNGAYVAMSVMLSILPLGMIGGVAFWLYRRVTRRERPVSASVPTATR